MQKLKFFLLVIFCATITVVNAQQVADTVHVSEIDIPNFKLGKGPIVYIDQLHNNFHTKEGRFQPFSKLMESDGYNIRPLANFTSLQANDILVISNAIHSNNVGNWRQPILSAFSLKEISTIKDWVYNGGRLLLIADHMPFSGAAKELAMSFGFNFCDGFAQLNNNNQPDVFSLENNRLVSSEITNGNYGNRLDAITTFTGSSFTIPKKAKGLLKFKKGDTCLQPDVAWQFNDTTPTKDLEESYQGAILEYGNGKLAVFGEAAMFTAQRIRRGSQEYLVGFNSPNAPNNIQFIRNLMFWLSQSNKN